jgi:hypothetical protein
MVGVENGGRITQNTPVSSVDIGEDIISITTANSYFFSLLLLANAPAKKQHDIGINGIIFSD